MSQLRLSICIATLNRATFIGATLESILSQATDEVEVVVVDGASTDNTQEVVAQASERYGRVRYLRLPKKGGVDQDYTVAADMAKGDYIWLFTDDDLFKPGAIAAVLAATQKDFSLVVVNAEVRSADLKEVVQEKRMWINADRTLAPKERDQLLADGGVYLSFIGGVVIRREVWQQRDKASYFGTVFVHVGVIFQSPLPGDALLMAKPWITIRYGNAQWVSRSFEIWMFKWPNLVWSFKDFSDWAKAKVVAREPWRSYPQLLMDRAMEHYCLKDYETWLAPRISSPLRRMITRGIATAPVGLLNLLARCFVRWVLRKVPCIALCDLEAWRNQRSSG